MIGCVILDRDVYSRVHSYVHNLEGVGSLKELPVRCYGVDYRQKRSRVPENTRSVFENLSYPNPKGFKPPGLMNKWLLELIGEQHTSDVCSTDI